ncbi:MAG: ferritin-like domain-containing protein [Rhodospirillaceae bacterium]|nr:ferritin-like domain-containing protein [Rhodospirillaceae bacterium]MBT6118782.1 ferritin-like domain-containing protein [Rhodospirillaceae bacterium]
MHQSTATIDSPRRDGRTTGPVRLGSDEHKTLFCRMLLDSFDAYKPAVIDWPKLEADALARLVGLPFWQVAVETESETSMRMQVFADFLSDPLLKEAVSLNAFEERRHKDVLEHMIRFYGIPLEPEPDFPVPTDPAGAFMSTGYGECFDSFFAFGLFRLAQDSGFFPTELVEVFEPVIQEEARHILFFANWIAWETARRPAWRKPGFLASRAKAIALKAWSRVEMARGGIGGNDDAASTHAFTATGHGAMGIDLNVRDFVDLCQSENARRMAPYDERLVRPQFIPRTMQAIRPLLRFA